MSSVLSLLSFSQINVGRLEGSGTLDKSVSIRSASRRRSLVHCSVCSLSEENPGHTSIHLRSFSWAARSADSSASVL